MSFPSNPFNEVRQQELKDKSLEFLEAFGKSYGINFLKCFVNQLIANAEGEEKDYRQLDYRPWSDVEKQDPFRGTVYMKSGGGQGDFGGWSQYYLVESPDFNIRVYGNEKEYQSKKKPKTTIFCAGYSVESSLTWHYQHEYDALKYSLNSRDEPTPDVMYSPYSWSLTHPNKPHYVFQLHEGKNAACGGCLGGAPVEPEGAGQDKAADRDNWITLMTKCTEKSSLRDTDSVKGQAFSATMDDIRGTLWNTLRNWEGDGTETEILVSMLVVHVVNPMRDDMLAEVTGPFMMKVKMAYKMSEMMQSMLEKMVDPAWKQMMKQVDEVQSKLEPKFQEAMNKIVEVKNMAKDKIKETFLDTLGELLKKFVSPYLEKIMKLFEKPLADGFATGRKVFEENSVNLPSDKTQLMLTLDAVPRTWSLVYDMVKAADELVAPLEELSKAVPDVFGYMYTCGLRINAENLLLETLDAAFFTLENRVNGGAGDAESQKKVVLEQFDHDVAIARNKFMKDTMREMILPPLKKAFTENAAFDALDDLVPSEVADFLNVRGMVEDVIDFTVGEPIDSTVDGAYPLPKEEAPPAGEPAAEPEA